MNKIHCNIIRDLFPAYLDKIISEQSKEMIETHLMECEECRNVLSALSQSIEVDTKEADREIDYLKKIRDKRKKIQLLTALCCTLIFGVIAIIGIKIFVIGEPISFVAIDGDKTDNYVGIGTRFNPETNELTLYGEIQLKQTVFSGIKVEEAEGLINAYNVIVYGAQRFGDTQEHNRKFEYTFKIPDDNREWSVYSVGKYAQDTLLFWSNAEYIDKKAEIPLQKLTDYLTIHEGFKSDESHLEREWSYEVLSDFCFIFNFHSEEDCAYRKTSKQYAVSVDGERIYYYDVEKETWVEI